MRCFVPFVGLAASVASASRECGSEVPQVDIPQCPSWGAIDYHSSVPDRLSFPQTRVQLCYTDTFLSIWFIVFFETSYYFNASQGTNDDIWMYEVMEAFISRGTDDPQTYLEFEVNPNNVTYQAFVYNPSKVRQPGAPFDHLFVSDPAADGFYASTEWDKDLNIWRSFAKIPLGLFNVDRGEAKGTHWRMNFFRTVVSPETYPNQTLGAWSPPDQANFHITPFFGDARFV